jgi:hypothetical protein
MRKKRRQESKVEPFDEKGPTTREESDESDDDDDEVVSRINNDFVTPIIIVSMCDP